MAKADRQVLFELSGDALRIGVAGRVVAAKVEMQDDPEVMIVELDSIEHWEDGEEVSFDDLPRILSAIERACDEREIEVEFE